MYGNYIMIYLLLVGLYKIWIVYMDISYIWCEPGFWWAQQNNSFIMHWKIRCIHWFILCYHYFLFAVVPEVSYDMSVIRKLLSVLVGSYIWNQYGHLYGHKYDNLNWSIHSSHGIPWWTWNCNKFVLQVTMLLIYLHNILFAIPNTIQISACTKYFLGLPKVISGRRHGRRKQSLGIRYVWNPDWF